MRRLARLISPLIAAAGAALWVTYADGGLRAPVSGLVLAGAALGFLIAGAFGRWLRAMLASVLAATVAVLVAFGDAPGGTSHERCDPACISTGGAVVLGAALAVLLALVGGILGAISDRRARRRLLVVPEGAMPGGVPSRR
jgi:hypothetical protein